MMFIVFVLSKENLRPLRELISAFHCAREKNRRFVLLNNENKQFTFREKRRQKNVKAKAEFHFPSVRGTWALTQVESEARLIVTYFAIKIVRNFLSISSRRLELLGFEIDCVRCAQIRRGLLRIALIEIFEQCSWKI